MSWRLAADPAVLAVILALAACTPAPVGKHPHTDPLDTPPTTNDPGASKDMTILPMTPGPAIDESVASPGSGKSPGSTCLLASECSSGVCEGEGCDNDHPGHCAEDHRMCTRDYRQYCTCDGKSFGGSGSCPGRRYASRGKCAS